MEVKTSMNKLAAALERHAAVQRGCGRVVLQNLFGVIEAGTIHRSSSVLSARSPAGWTEGRGHVEHVIVSCVLRKPIAGLAYTLHRHL